MTIIDESISLPNTNESFLRNETLIQIFKDSVKQYGNKTAVTFNGQSFTYKELDDYSDAVAENLLELGVEPGHIVGIFLTRGYNILIASLGALKAGAAYIPFDRETPIDRVKNVLADVGAQFCFCDTNLPEPLVAITVSLSQPTTNYKGINYAHPDNYAYIIFTSGTTGTPKGIPIKHKQISHLLRAENSVLNIKATDIVYQGFSDSFDMWFEENWISLFAGAEICIADASTAKSLDTLHHFLNKNKVTVLHAVPSLLALLDTNIPTLRLINSGGEACKPNVLKKWGRLPLQFFNSYGPTETTVSATFIELRADDEISIGYPLPNYGMAVVNEKLEPVPIGVEGEIVLSGISLSDGYINKPELNAKVFLPKPPALHDLPGDRIYMSGDKGTMTEDGRFKVIGRKDDQVKIRGYRVELGEIEVVLNNIPSIKTGAIGVKNIRNMDTIVAYYIPNDNEPNIDERLLREQMAALLPTYMVPSYFMKVADFKWLPSGKVDRKALPEWVVAESEDNNLNEEILNQYAGNTIAESIIQRFTTTFPGQVIKKENDFFNDLGGHSMLAAIFVSEIREIEGLENISIIDIYQKRTVEGIINYWITEKYTTKKQETQTFHPIPTLRYYLCGFFQAIALILLFGLQAAQIFVPYLGYYIVAQEVDGYTIPILAAIALLCMVPPFMIVVSVVMRNLFIGKFKEGDYPLWGAYYFKWWLYGHIVGLIPLETFGSSPLYPFLMKLVGIRTGKDSQLSNFGFGSPDLINIGKNVTISSNVILNNVWVEDGLIKFRPITLKDNCHIGTSCIVNGGCVVEEGSILKDLSCLGFGLTMPKNSIWEGSPAKLVDRKQEEIAYKPVSRAKRLRYKLFFSGLVFLIPTLLMLPIIPTIIGLHYLDEQAADYSFYYLITTPLFALSYILLFIAEMIVLSKLLKGRIKVGRYSVYSHTYVWKWFLDQMFSLSLNVLRPIFATVFIPSLYRALGAKVGKNTEISNASNVTHHLLEIGEESFIADAAVIGETDIRNQELIIEKTIIGNKSFVGNSALIPQGYRLGDNKLIGVTSIPPLQNPISDNEPSDWFGSPAVRLPRRITGTIYPDWLTYKPSFTRRAVRTIIEFMRILIPETVTLSLGLLFIAYTHDLLTSDDNFFMIFLQFPFYYIGIVSIPSFLFCLLIKWVLIGKYREEQYPMWTWKVWRTEAVTSIFEALATPFLLTNLQGTPFLPFLFRLMGVKVGKRVWMNTADITEFDMVTLGDDCAFNTYSGPQTHLFEDRVMKIGKVDIGERSSIGAGSVVLYNTEIENNCKVGPLSLVMKGEHLLKNTNWFGIPIERL